MNDLIIKTFKGNEVFSFIWNNKPCWVATDIADLFGYSQKSRAISDCIIKENFEVGIEYDVLEGERLKCFKEIFKEKLGETKYAPKVVILFEEGIYGFLAYTQMPLGVEFRQWIRKEVMTDIRKRGYYISDINNNDSIYEDDDSFSRTKISYELNNDIDKLKLAYDSAKMIKELLDDITKDSTYKYLVIKQIYNSVGIKLPKYIDEERF
ncbi:MAG: BRO family protein [Sarcina sp.]